MGVISSFLLLLLLCPPCSFRPIPQQKMAFNLLLTVKTTRANHDSRLKEAIGTWAAPTNRPEGTQILFISDSPLAVDQWPEAATEVLDSGCPLGHQNEALCCKMAFELRSALDQRPPADFWCHFDDDSFVLLANLRTLLLQYPSHLDLYIGHASTSEPISLCSQPTFGESRDPLFSRRFWFGTGGAGFCLSQSTLGKLRLFVSDQSFETLCSQLGVPDDVTMGFVLSNLLGINLTNSELFHSHLERLGSIPRNKLSHQISLSAASAGQQQNVVDVPTIFPLWKDPMRFRSLQKFISWDLRQL